MPAGTSKVQVTGLRELKRDLRATGEKFGGLDFSGIAAEGLRLAAAFAPKKTGALAASIKGRAGKNRATIKAGSTRVPYAAAINYGWPSRGIKPAGFMQQADAVLRRTAPRQLEAQVARIIAARGLA